MVGRVRWSAAAGVLPPRLPASDSQLTHLARMSAARDRSIETVAAVYDPTPVYPTRMAEERTSAWRGRRPWIPIRIHHPSVPSCLTKRKRSRNLPSSRCLSSSVECLSQIFGQSISSSRSCSPLVISKPERSSERLCKPSVCMRRTHH